MNEVHERQKTSITTPSDTEIRIERIFDAPRQLVWDAYHDPELLPEWLGPRELTTTVDEFDLRSGGSYRFIHRSPDGNEFVFFGEIREVDEPNAGATAGGLTSVEVGEVAQRRFELVRQHAHLVGLPQQPVD